MKICLQILTSLLFPTLLFSQHGKVFDHLSMKSEILNMDRNYAIYLPPSYDESERSYPVLYLLHGGGDDQTGWVQFGEVLHIADKAIKNGTATEMIIVMPDADTGQRGYSNNYSGEWRYEDYFFDELMPHVEETYRIKREKRFRAVAGLSMGGGGSFYYALHRPELFSAACPLSAATGPINRESMEKYIEWFSMENATDEQLETWCQAYSVLELIKNAPDEQLKSVRWYIDCGDDDFLYEGNALVHIEMRKREIPHEYRVRDGGHKWTYWRDSLPAVLSFVSDGFHQY